MDIRVKELIEKIETSHELARDIALEQGHLIAVAVKAKDPLSSTLQNMARSLGEMSHQLRNEAIVTTEQLVAILKETQEEEEENTDEIGESTVA